MRETADRPLILHCQDGGHEVVPGEAGGVALPAHNGEHEEVGPEEDLEDEETGDRHGRGFPMMRLAQWKFSVIIAMGLDTYVGTAHGCPGPIRPQTSPVRHPDPQCRTVRR